MKYFENIIKNLLTRRMIAFYIACILIYLKPEVATQITILATAIIGNSAIDSITNKMKEVNEIKELEKNQSS